MADESARERRRDKYKVTNWREYNKSLVKRGDIRVFMDNDVWEAWRRIEPGKKKGREKVYPDAAILYCLLVRAQYRLTFRQTQGFLSSLFALTGLPLPAPDCTQMNRRQAALPVEVSRRIEAGEKLNVGIDSTGLKVYGEGEWKVRKHGASKRRTWMKLHICIDLDNQRILRVNLTGNDKTDADAGGGMLSGDGGEPGTEWIGSFTGDGGYDAFKFRELLGSGVKQIIPPKRNSVLPGGGARAGSYLEQRDEAVEYIKEHGREAWKEAAGYHRRSLNEVAMYRYKTIAGEKLRARDYARQEREVRANCLMLNRYFELGRPVSVKVTA